MKRGYILLLFLVLISIVSSDTIVWNSLPGTGGSNESLWYNNSGVTTSDWPVKINGRVTIDSETEPGFFTTNTLLLGNSVTQSCVGCGFYVQNITSHNYVGASTGVYTAHGSVCDLDDDICLNDTVPDNLQVVDLGEDTFNVSWSDVKGRTVWDTFTVSDDSGSNYYVTGISVTENGDVQNISLTRNGGLSTLWATFTDNNTGGGGSVSDDWVNETGDTMTGKLTINAGRSMELTTVGVYSISSNPIFKINGTYAGSAVWAAMDFNPLVNSGNLLNFWVRPTINTTAAIYGTRYAPSYTGTGNRQWVSIAELPGTKLTGYNLTYGVYEQSSMSRSMINDPSILKYTGTNTGGPATCINFAGGNSGIHDTQYTIKGGAATLLGSCSIFQRGVVFDDWTTNATADTKALTVLDGGVFDFTNADTLILPTKTPYGGFEGQVSTTTASNSTKSYVGGAWREMVNIPTYSYLQYGQATMSADGYFKSSGYITNNEEIGYTMMRPGSITGLSVNYEVNSVTGAGDIAWKVYKNGAAVAALTITKTYSATDYDETVWTTVPVGTATFVAGDTLSIYEDFVTMTGQTRNHVGLIEVAYT